MMLQNTVQGVVVDESGLPLPNVSVVIQGTNNGTVTNFDGEFQIQASDGDVLLFSFVGYVTRTMPVQGQTNLRVQLQEDEQALDEVVVVAFGSANKNDVVGSVSQIKGEQIENRALTNPVAALEGTVSGVQFSPSSGQPGERPILQIRGIGSVNANREPLYVVDGVVFTGSFSSINPGDIESISVLKDASSTALYGNKAANGVVIITTKGGKKGGTFTVNINQGLSTRGIPEYERVDARQYYPLMWEAYRNSLSFSGEVSTEEANQIASGLLPRNDNGQQVLNGERFDDISQILGYNPFNVPDTQIVDVNGQLNPNASLLYPDDLDWQEPLTRTGLRNNTYVSYAGASDKADYFMSIGHVREEGYVIKSDFERLTARLNMNAQVKKYLKVGLNLAGATTTSNQAVDGADDNSNSFVNPFFSTRVIGPIYPVFQRNPQTGELVLDDNGERIFDTGDIDRDRASGATPGRHVIQETLLNVDKDDINTISGRTFAEFSFLKNFTFRFNAGLDKRFFANENFDNKIVGDGAPDGRGGRNTSITTSITYNQLLTYKNSFGAHSVELLAGHESFDYEFNFLTGFRQNQVVDGNTELINFTNTINLNSFTRTYVTEGYLSRFNYDFAKRYYLSLSYRRDASSRFSKAERWGNFFSVGGSWRLSNENFLADASFINVLKLRGSYGEVGNDSNLDRTPINFFVSRPLFELNNNNAGEGGIQADSFGNEDLTWETNRQYDVGLDFELFNSRISGSVEYYNRESDDLLFEVPKPLSAGITDRIENIGTLVNSGIEINAAFDIIRSENVGWDIEINASTINNEFKRLPQEEIITGTKKLVVGGSIFDFWLRDWYGVDPADGAALYVAEDSVDPNDASLRTVDGVLVTTDQNKAKFNFVGTAIPDLFGSFRNTVRFKNISLNTLFAYQIGGDTYDSNYASILSSGDFGEALHVDILKRWQKPGDITDVPRLDNAQLAPFGAASDRWLTDSSFLNLRQVNLTYQLPARLIDVLQLKSASIYANAENLYVWNARKGLDVNQAFNGTSVNRFTPARIISLGLNVTF